MTTVKNFDSTVSVSQGCFVFKRKKSGKRKKRRKSVDSALGDCLYSDLWYLSYKDSWNAIDKDLEILRTQGFEKVLADLICYVNTCYESVDTRFQENILPVAGLLTGINVPDHVALFDSLITQLKQQVTPHVAVLQSRECKFLRTAVEKMVAQFICKQGNDENHEEQPVSSSSEEDSDSSNDEDMGNNRYSCKMKKVHCNFPVLSAWYNCLKENFRSKSATPKKKDRHQHKYNKPLVVVIPDFESFPHEILKDFILICSGYVPQLPIVIILGVATSSLAVSRSLPYNVSSRVRIQLFQTPPSTAILNSVIEQVFFSNNIFFRLGSRTFQFLTDIFLFYDFSVQGFIQAYKLCMMEHYSGHDWKALSCAPDLIESRLSALSSKDLDCLRGLPSMRSYIESLPSKQRAPLLLDDCHFREVVKKLLEELRAHLKNFHIGLQCLHIFTSNLPTAPLGKNVRELYVSSVSQPVVETGAFRHCFQLMRVQSQEELSGALKSALDLLTKLREGSDDMWSPKLYELHSRMKSTAADFDDFAKLADFAASPNKWKTPPKKGRSGISSFGSPSKEEKPPRSLSLQSPTFGSPAMKSGQTTPTFGSPAKKSRQCISTFGSPPKEDGQQTPTFCSPAKRRISESRRQDTPEKKDGMKSPVLRSPGKRVVPLKNQGLSSPAKEVSLPSPLFGSPSKKGGKTGRLLSRTELKEKLLELKQKQAQGDDYALSQFEIGRRDLLSYLSEDAFPVLLRPPTSLPLAEVIFFDNLACVKSLIVGAPRGAIHAALGNPQSYLECECCELAEPNSILPSLPDICIAYKLHLESGRLIALADWLQAFSAIIDPEQSCIEDDDKPEISPHIQARFTRAVNELQFLGFVKATKRKVDHVARLTWGGC